MSTMMTFPQASPESLGIPSAAIERYLDHVRDSRLELNSLMIIRHGRLAASGWWAPYSAQRLHAAHSLTKSFTSTAIGLMIHEGRIGLHDRVADLFPADMPENPSENLLEMTLWHLLTMTCGHETEAVPGDEPNYARAFLAHPVPRKPGTHYIYNSMASYMLAVLVYERTGRNLLDYLRPRILDPLGFGEVFCLRCPRGIENGGGGMYLRTVDIARMAQLYLQMGLHGGRQLIPAAWVAEASAWQVSTSGHPAGDGDHISGFGYHIWRCIPPDAYRFAGANGQFGIVIPSRDAVIAVTASSWNTAGITEGLWDILLPAMADGDLPEDPQATEHLRTRMASLKTDWASLTPALRDKASEALLEGESFAWPAGNGFTVAFRHGLVVPGISSAAFTFGISEAVLDYVEDGTAGQLRLGLDGTPRENPMVFAGHTFPVLAAGSWIGDGVFQADLRSILNVAHRRLRFRSDGGSMRITIESTPNTADMTHPPALELTAAFAAGA